MAENTLLEYYERIVKECLTECDGVCLLYNNGNCECVDGNTLDHLKELKAYRDAEEQGLLLRLPCRPWDKLYWISDPDDEYNYEPIEEVEVCEISYNGYSIQLWFSDKGEKEFPVLPSVAIGEELFFTKEEAEAVMEKMKEQENVCRT